MSKVKGLGRGLDALLAPDQPQTQDHLAELPVLLAQGVSAGEAARLAVYWHGRAGDDLSLSMGTCGLLAGDLLRHLPQTRLGILRNGGSLC
jgi:hypothetical protein